MAAERKAIAVGVSVVTHLVLLWAILPPAAKPQIEAGVVSASLIDGDALANAATPKRAPAEHNPERQPDKVEAKPDIEPLPIADILPPLDTTSEPVELGETVRTQAASAAAAALAANGDPCAVGAWLQAALQNDPAIEAALASVPRSARSVANAVMLWNGQWAQPRADAAKGIAAIRALVVTGIASAPETCQRQPISGPVLISVGEPTNSTVLAIGSGQWRWSDLLTEIQ